MISIKGEYCFTIPFQTMFLNTELKIRNDNIITLLGESFFLNRWINDEFKPISYIVLGKGTGRPRKTNVKLGKQTVQKSCETNVDLVNKRLILSCTFTAAEIVDTTEIGVSNGDILISHDLYKQISQELLLNDTTSTVYLEYMLNLATGSIRSNWLASNEGNNIYYIYEPSQVVGVIENNTQSGYNRKNSIDELKGETGTYYYNNTTKNLYIRNTSDSDPNSDEIIVQTR